MSRRTLHSMLLVWSLLWASHGIGAAPVRVFNTDNGLPHNRVNRIGLDSRGFLWICTDDGLARFDGHQFVTYTTADGLPHMHVNGVLETRSGEYWVATDGGLSRFDPRPGHARFTNYAPPGPVEARYVNAVVEEEDGTLTVGTDTGLYRLRPSQPQPIFERIDYRAPTDSRAAAKVRAVARDQSGRLWLATEYGLYQRAGRTWSHYDTRAGLPSLFVSSFTTDRDGRVWAGFQGGFGRIALEPAPGRSVLDFVRTDKTGVLGQEVKAMLFSTDGRRWIGTDTGLTEWVVDSNGSSRFQPRSLQDGRPGEALLSLMEDTAGSIWIGTRRSGLIRAAWSTFQTFTASDGLRLGRDQTLLETDAGQVCLFDVGDRRNRVYRQDKGRFAATLPALPLSVAPVTHWLQTGIQDHTAAWWFSTVSGLFRFPTLGGRSDLHLLADCQVDRFFEDATGDVWISNWTHGDTLAKLARWERLSGRVLDETHRLPQVARKVGIAAFAQDRSGAIWIGLQRPGGLLRLRAGKFEPVSGGIRGHINDLFVDSQGRLWIASTESGLGLVADPTAGDPQLRHYTRADGLSGEEVWCVTDDRLGRIYAGTAKGIDRLMPATGQVVHYSSADGLVRGDIRSALRDRAGNLWFASAYGVSRFTPGEDRATPPSNARITGVRVAGVPLSVSDLGDTDVGPLSLRSHERSLQIDFAATDYHTLGALKYQFKLTPAEAAGRTAAWQDAGMNATVHLASLAAGDYAFSVRALGPDGLAGKPASLVFAIAQPLWWRWWFQCACALTAVALAYAVHTHRLRNQLAIERVRSHIAMDLHDDIGASLSRVSVISEALKSRLPARDLELHSMLDDIAASSRRLITEMGDIVWSLDPRRDQVGELASRLRAFGSDLLEARGVEWSVEAPVAGLHHSVPPDVRRQLFLVFKEGIHNIGKHSDATKATLRLQVHDGHIRGELTDDGCGIAAARTHGNGFASMRARVEDLAGFIDISPASEGGTRIRIDVPFAKRA